MATEADLTFTLSDDGTYYSVSATDSSTISGELVIPAEHEGLPVRIYDGYAFGGCTGITSVTFPDSINTIPYRAFITCRGLTSFIVPSTIQYIAINAFYECSGLTYFKFEGNAPTLLDYNGSIWTGSDESATEMFYNAKSLSCVYVNAGTTGWGETWCGLPVVVESASTSERLKIGTETVFAARLGNKAVTAMYLGDTKVYEANS